MKQNFDDGSYEIVGAAFKVHRALGQGLREKPYENALIIELRKTWNLVEQQKSYPIFYEGAAVGECITDIIVNREILIEVKSVENLSSRDEAQALNYLRISGLKTGLLLNFYNESVEIRRLGFEKS